MKSELNRLKIFLIGAFLIFVIITSTLNMLYLNVLVERNKDPYSEEDFVEEVVRRFEENNPWTNKTNPPYTCVPRAEDLHLIFKYLGVFSQVQSGHQTSDLENGHAWVEQCDSYLVEDRTLYTLHKQVRIQNGTNIPTLSINP